MSNSRSSVKQPELRRSVAREPLEGLGKALFDASGPDKEILLFGALSGLADEIIFNMSSLLSGVELKKDETNKFVLRSIDDENNESENKKPNTMENSLARRNHVILTAGFLLGMSEKQICWLGEKPMGNEDERNRKKMSNFKSDEERLVRYIENVKRYAHGKLYSNQPESLSAEGISRVNRFFEAYKPYLTKMPDEKDIDGSENKLKKVVKENCAEYFKYSQQDYNNSKAEKEEWMDGLIGLNACDDTVIVAKIKSEIQRELDKIAKNMDELSKEQKKPAAEQDATKIGDLTKQLKSRGLSGNPNDDKENDTRIKNLRGLQKLNDKIYGLRKEIRELNKEVHDIKTSPNKKKNTSARKRLDALDHSITLKRREIQYSEKALENWAAKMESPILDEQIKGFRGGINSIIKEMKSGTTHGKSFKEKAGISIYLEFESRPEKERALIEKQIEILEEIADKLISIDQKYGRSVTDKSMKSTPEVIEEKKLATNELVKDYFNLRDEQAMTYDSVSDNVLKRDGVERGCFRPTADALNSTQLETGPAVSPVEARNIVSESLSEFASTGSNTEVSPPPASVQALAEEHANNDASRTDQPPQLNLQGAEVKSEAPVIMPSTKLPPAMPSSAPTKEEENCNKKIAEQSMTSDGEAVKPPQTSTSHRADPFEKYSDPTAWPSVSKLSQIHQEKINAQKNVVESNPHPTPGKRSQ